MRCVPLCFLPLVFALALAACGGSDDEPEPADADQAEEQGGPEAAAQAVAEGFMAALNSDDAEAACDFLDESAQNAVSSESEEAEDCVTAFPDYKAGLPEVEFFEIGEVEVGEDLDGETEIVTVTLDHPDEDAVAMEVREIADGEWRATRVPGTSLGGA